MCLTAPGRRKENRRSKEPFQSRRLIWRLVQSIIGTTDWPLGEKREISHLQNEPRPTSWLSGPLILAIGLTFWPLIAATAILASESFASLPEYFVHRGIGHLVLVIALIISLLASLRIRPQIKPKLSATQGLLIALVAVSIIYSTAYAQPDLRLLIPFSIYLFLDIMAVLCCVALFSKWPRETLRWVWNAMFLSMIVYLPAFAFIILSNPGEQAFGWNGSWFPVQNVRWFAALVVIAIAAGTAGPWRGEAASKPFDALRPFLLFILWTILFWTGSRAQVLGILGALTMLAVVGGQRGRRIAIRAMKIAAPSLLVSVTLPVPNGSYGFLHRFLWKMVNEETMNALSSRRTEMWAASFQKIMEKPLFGHGIGQFRSTTDYRFNAYHSHSFPIEALLNLGLIGGGALIALVIGRYWGLTRNAMSIGLPRDAMPPFLVMTTILLMSLISGGVLLITISVYFILSAAGLWAVTKQHTNPVP
ncbi:MAG: O-antigen ligase family protein [Thalassovita sp.]|nr:O-antigen ligase family protein [Thalassovita sp.]